MQHVACGYEVCNDTTACHDGTNSLRQRQPPDQHRGHQGLQFPVMPPRKLSCAAFATTLLLYVCACRQMEALKQTFELRPGFEFYIQ
jgi:hypothetical protein